MEFIKITEQPSLYDDLDKKSVKEILEDINTEDHKVADAVQKAIPQIEKLVTLIIPRVKKGGRIFYMGAGTSGRLGVLDASEIPPTFGMPPTVVIGLIAGGDTALRNPVENAEDDMSRGWEELLQHHINSEDTVIGIAASGTYGNDYYQNAHPSPYHRGFHGNAELGVCIHFRSFGRHGSHIISGQCLFGCFHGSYDIGRFPRLQHINLRRLKRHFPVHGLIGRKLDIFQQ